MIICGGSSRLEKVHLNLWAKHTTQSTIFHLRANGLECQWCKYKKCFPITNHHTATNEHQKLKTVARKTHKLFWGEIVSISLLLKSSSETQLRRESLLWGRNISLIRAFITHNDKKFPLNIWGGPLHCWLSEYFCGWELEDVYCGALI